MVRAKHMRPIIPKPLPTGHPRRRLAMMTARAGLVSPKLWSKHQAKHRPKRKKWPPPWRKHEDVELGEEVRDLERDLAFHSEAHSGAKDGQTQAHDERPGAQERDNAETETPTTSWTRRRRSTSTRNPVPKRNPVPRKNPVPRSKNTVVDLSQEICDLDRDIALHPDISANTSPRDTRALNRAAARIARLEAAQVRESRKPKKAMRK